MRRTNHIIVTSCAVLAIVITALQFVITTVHADATNAPSLVISHLKITSSSGQFVTLYNASNAAIDTAKYQLVYFNNYDVSKATASKLVALSGVVPPHGYALVSDATAQLCYQMTVMSVSLGFSSTAGFVELQTLNQTFVGGPITTTTLDYVGWSKTAASGAQSLPSSTAAFLVRNPLSAQNSPIINSPGDGTWAQVQPDPSNSCSYITVSTGKTTAIYGTLLPATQPPASYESSPDNAAIIVNDGLMAPVINELLPNPAGTGNDATDEYIEIYNPNVSTFDLSGYELRTGSTNQHSFTFPNASQLPAQSFTAFYAASTGLSLSNSGGQAALYDPNGTQLSVSDSYDAAKDGYAWALANGTWQWTTTPTPSAINTIHVPPSTKKKATVKKASTATPSTKSASVSTTGTVLGTTTKSSNGGPDLTPLHPWVLALVACLALLYGAYEFRTDMARLVSQSRRNVTHRLSNWRALAWWRSH